MSSSWGGRRSDRGGGAQPPAAPHPPPAPQARPPPPPPPAFRRVRPPPSPADRSEPDPPRLLSQPWLGGGISRALLGRPNLPLPLRAERHARVPPQGPCEERRRQVGRSILRIRSGDGPLREPRVPAVGPADLHLRARVHSTVLLRPPGEGRAHPPRVQGLGRRRDAPAGGRPPGPDP